MDFFKFYNNQGNSNNNNQNNNNKNNSNNNQLNFTNTHTKEGNQKNQSKKKVNKLKYAKQVRSKNPNSQNQKDTSYSIIIGKCRFYEINKSTFFSVLMKRIAQKFLSQDLKSNQIINEILIRAQGKEEVKMIKKIYSILTDRFQGVSTIFHKCFTRMLYQDERGKNQGQNLKRCVEVIFIKNPTNEQRKMKGFRQPKKDGNIMNYEEYKKTYNQKKDLEQEIDQKKEDELQIAEAIFVKSFLRSDVYQQNISDGQLMEEQKQNSQYQIQHQEEEEEQDDDQDEESQYNDDEEESNDEDNFMVEEAEETIDYQSLTENMLFKKVEQKVQSINPHLKNIVKEDLKLSCSYMLTQKVVNQKPEVVKELEQESEQFMMNVAQKFSNIQIKSQPLSKLNPQDQKDIVKAALFQHYREQDCKVQITNKKNNDQTYANSYQSQLVLTGQIDQLKFIEVSIEDKDFTYQKVVSEPQIKNIVLSRFVNATSKQYKVQPDSITILDIQKGPRKSVNFIISVDGLQIEKANNIGLDKYKEEFPKAQISSTVKSLIDNYQISDDYFNEKFNMYWGPEHNNMLDYRGSLPKDGKELVRQRYYFPVGFQGYGLNVDKWLEQDKTWFGQNSNPNVWIVLYHATDGNGFKGISNSYIQPGQNNAYGGAKCRLTGKTILSGQGANTYFSDRVSGPNSSEGYGGKICLGQKNYILIFQCRVNPKHVRSPVNMESYYTVEKQYAQQSVRPYRILLKEV
ncbi:hypothetical protein ABPG74_004719 [Tetrahymena malaccensis]